MTANRLSDGRMRAAGDLTGLEIVVPGSIANLGPGLDTLAVAIQLYLRVRVVEVVPWQLGSLTFRFNGRQLLGANLIEVGFRELAGDRRDFPSLVLEVESDIPMASGLGSSAAALVAGFRLYEAMLGARDNDELLSAGCRLEGHADNIAACLIGGLAVCCQAPDDSVVALGRPWPADLRFVVLTPQVSLSTGHSRTVLPPSVPMVAAVANLQRVALLLQAIDGGADQMLRLALEDSLHQPYRKAVVPGLTEALKIQHPDLLGVFLGGSGPSLVALCRENAMEVESLLAASFRPQGIPFETRIVAAHINESGTTVAHSNTSACHSSRLELAAQKSPALQGC